MSGKSPAINCCSPSARESARGAHRHTSHGPLERTVQGRESRAGAHEESLATKIDADNMVSEKIMTKKAIDFGRFGEIK